jgi:hypothetical protein
MTTAGCKRLWEEALPAERAPPLVILAGCSTGQDTQAERSPFLAMYLGTVDWLLDIMRANALENVAKQFELAHPRTFSL